MKCANCNVEISNLATHCYFCGAKIENRCEFKHSKDYNTNVLDSVNAILTNYPSVSTQTSKPIGAGGSLTGDYHNRFSELYEKLYPTVAEIHLARSTGTGVFLGDGYIATNAHVVIEEDKKNGRRMIAPKICVLHLGKKYQAEVVNLNDKQDVAIIKLSGNYPNELNEITSKVGNCSKLAPGDKIFSIGNSMGHGLSFNEFSLKQFVGHSPYSPYNRYKELIIMNGTAQGGNSGGPLYSATGEVVGLLTASPITSTTMYIPTPQGMIEVDANRPEPGVCYGVTVNTLIELIKETFEE